MVMETFYCAVVGVAGSVFPVDIDTNKSVGHLKQAIRKEKMYQFPADELQLFLAKRKATEEEKEKGDDKEKWLTQLEALKGVRDTRDDKKLPIPGVKLRAVGLASSQLGEVSDEEEAAGNGPVHVLVVVPEGAVGSALLQQVNTVAHQDVVWYGMQGSVGRGEGIDPNDKRTLSRGALTAGIISRLEETHVVLVKSPPMTGKTSLATLMSRALVNKHREERKKAAVFNFSVLTMTKNQTFEDIFKERCGVNWEYAKATLPRSGCMVYMVLDETQVIYEEATSSPKHKSSAFWELAKQVLIEAAYHVRILMFAAYGSGVEYTRLATPIHFDE